MRDIKFRAWDYDRNVMDFFDLRSYDDSFHDNFGTIEQFTGLEDKNGVEIYEDDVVRFSCGDKMKVIFNNGAFEVSGSYNMLASHSWEDCEVIGNIHENPELLEEI